MTIVKNPQSQDNHYKYAPPDSPLLYKKLTQLLECFKLFLSAYDDLDYNDVTPDNKVLSELLVRVDKRKDYFVIFHEDTIMNELKESALIAYWIIKFKPFSIKDDYNFLNDNYRYLNEGFAIFLLYSAIKEESKRFPNISFKISNNYTSKLMYAFKYWDISKEAMILVAESLFESMRACEGNNSQQS